eukprot:6936472-Pyramimonas_sp.AAC.1
MHSRLERHACAEIPRDARGGPTPEANRRKQTRLSDPTPPGPPPPAATVQERAAAGEERALNWKRIAA